MWLVVYELSCNGRLNTQITGIYHYKHNYYSFLVNTQEYNQPERTTQSTTNVNPYSADSNTQSSKGERSDQLQDSVDNQNDKPTRKKRGRPPLTAEERAIRPKPSGTWKPGGPGRPPLGEGQSKARNQVYLLEQSLL